MERRLPMLGAIVLAVASVSCSSSESTDECVHASPEATCCEGKSYTLARSATPCGVTCTDIGTCKGGVLVDDLTRYQDCLFFACPKKEKDAGPDVAKDVADTCVHVSEDATCCEGEDDDLASTVCGGVPCTIYRECSGGKWQENTYDCEFKSKACADAGAGADADASGG